MPKSTKEAVNDTAEAASLLVRAEVERFKLKLAKALTKWITHLVVGFVLMLMFSLLLVFIGLAGAAALEQYVSESAAFASIAGIYALVAVLIYAFRMRLIGDNVLRSILKELFDES
jgi:hypothetical protein